MKYNNRLEIRLSDDEKESLAVSASKLGLSVTDYVRGLLFVRTDKEIVRTSVATTKDVRTDVTKGNASPVVQSNPVKQPSSPKNEKPFVCLLKGVK